MYSKVVSGYRQRARGKKHEACDALAQQNFKICETTSSSPTSVPSTPSDSPPPGQMTCEPEHSKVLNTHAIPWWKRCIVVSTCRSNTPGRLYRGKQASLMPPDIGEDRRLGWQPKARMQRQEASAWTARRRTPSCRIRSSCRRRLQSKRSSCS